MSSSEDAILSKVTAIVAEQLAIPASELDPAANLRNVQGADSVKTLRVIAKVEKEFDVMLEDEEVFAVTTILDLVGLIQKNARAA